MRVWTTVIGQRLDDAENTRSMLLAAALMRRGHDVTMWTSAFDHIRKLWRDEGREGFRREDGLRVRFMRGCGYRANVGPRRFLDHLLAARDFRRQAAGLERPDVIVASLPDHLTAEAAVRLGREVGAPTVVDVRDKWPDIFLEYVGGGVRRRALGLALAGESARTRRLLRHADCVVSMMPSLLRWALDKAERPPTARERVFYLATGGAPDPRAAEGLPEAGPARRAVALTRGAALRVLFVGTFNQTQHPSLLLDAVERIAAAGLAAPGELAVVIGGAGVGADEVARRAARLPGVHYVGWLGRQEIDALAAASDVGVLPMTFRTAAFNNKTFTYLGAGLPIVSGAAGDLEELVEREGLGINVPAGDAAALAAAILALLRDPGRRARMAANVRRVFAERFGRERSYAEFAAHVEGVAAAGARRAGDAWRGSGEGPCAASPAR